MFRNPEDGAHLPSDSSCAPQDSFHVSGTIPEFFMRRSMSFSGLDRAEDSQPDDDMSDDGSQMLGEKKRRLNLEQVKALEKSFELGNKLEPERKMRLARDLGLQPRQVAIWFQNRRARWKTKQMEKDYDVLKRQFEALKSDNNALKSQNKKLQSQLFALKSKEPHNVSTAINLNKENEACWSNGSDNSYNEVNLNVPSTDNTLYTRINNNNNKNIVIFPSPMEISAPNLPDYFQNHKINNDHHPPSSNHQIFNMFGNIEESQDFWPWHEQQQNYQ